MNAADSLAVLQPVRSPSAAAVPAQAAGRARPLDELTGLPTRSALLEELRLRAADGGFALLVLDVDRTRRVNQSLGRAAGDELLRAVGARLATSVGPGGPLATPWAARTGGDRFALLVDGVGTASAAQALADALGERCARPHRLGGTDVVATASIGVTVADAGVTADALLAQAELALEEAKRRGTGSRVVFDPALQPVRPDTLTLEAELREALANGQLRVAFQPIVDLEDGRAVGLEALVRWRHPLRGELSPAMFVPLAESCGLIASLGECVLAASLRAYAGWRRDGVAVPPRLSVNLSRAQLADAGLPQRVKALLAEAGLPPSVLQLEITESLAMHDGSVRDALAALRAIGVRLSLDDFGTGHSSLAALNDFPVQQVKIDRAFVCGLGQGGYHRALVRACLQVAESLDLEVVAEGVETVEQARELAALGCRRAQGWLYARALEAADVPAFLAAPGRRVLTDGELPEPAAEATVPAGLPAADDDGERSAVLPRRLWLPRIGALLLGGAMVAEVLLELGAHPAAWVALALHVLVWPHVARALALRSRLPGRTERRNLLADSLLSAVWLPAMHFQPLPTLALLTMVTMQNLSVGGLRLFGLGLLAQAAGVLLGVAVFGFAVLSQSSPETMALSLVFLAGYPVIIGLVTRRMSRQLHRQRAELARAQRLQREVLEAVDAAIVLWDADDRLVFWNKAFAQQYAAIADRLEPGVTFEALLRAAVATGTLPEARENPEAFVEERLRQHRFSSFPIVRRTADGRWRRIVERRLPEGGLIAYCTDITELMAARR